MLLIAFTPAFLHWLRPTRRIIPTAPFKPHGLDPTVPLSQISAVLKRNPFIIPSAPVLDRQPPTGPHWLHEVKFDGWRAQLHKAGDEVANSRVRGTTTPNGSRRSAIAC